MPRGHVEIRSGRPSRQSDTAQSWCSSVGGSGSLDESSFQRSISVVPLRGALYSMARAGCLCSSAAAPVPVRSFRGFSRFCGLTRRSSVVVSPWVSRRWWSEGSSLSSGWSSNWTISSEVNQIRNCNIFDWQWVKVKTMWWWSGERRWRVSERERHIIG